MQLNKLSRTVALALMGLTLSSLTIPPERSSRTVACLPDGGGLSAGPVVFGSDLINRVQDHATRQNAQDWYYYLTQVELGFLSQRQATRTSYGIQTPLFANGQDLAIPSLAPLQLNPVYGAANSGLFAAPKGFTGFVGSVNNPYFLSRRF